MQNCSFNQFAIVTIRRARDRVSTLLGMYKCSSEIQVQREKHCGKGTGKILVTYFYTGKLLYLADFPNASCVILLYGIISIVDDDMIKE